MSEPSSTTWAAVGRYAREVARCYIRDWYRHSFRRWWRRRWVTRRLRRHGDRCLCTACSIRSTLLVQPGAMIPVRTPRQEGWSPNTTLGQIARSGYPRAVQEYFRTDPDELANVYHVMSREFRLGTAKVGLEQLANQQQAAATAHQDQYAQMRQTMTDPVALAALEQLSNLAARRAGQQDVALGGCAAPLRWTDLT